MMDFLKRFEDTMASAAFAEAGEFDAAIEMLGGKNSNKKVLLGEEGAVVSEKAFKYALGLCRRVGARLEILHVLRPSEAGEEPIRDVLARAKARLKPLFARLEEKGVAYRLNFGEGRLEEEVALYAQGRRDIMFVVISARERNDKERTGLEQRASEVLKKLGCPLVVVSEPVNP